MQQKTPTNRMCHFGGGYISALQKVGFTLVVSLWGSLCLATESLVYKGLNVGFWSQSAKANDHREERHGVRMGGAGWFPRVCHLSKVRISGCMLPYFFLL